MSTAEATILPNKTFTGGKARHVGQLYIDEALKSAVEALAPYNTNTQAVTTNAQDGIAPDEATAEYDPFLQYVHLGEKLSDGLLMWITIGVNSSADNSAGVTPAAHYYEGGGETVEGAGGSPSGPGGPGGPPPSVPGGNTTGTAVGSGTGVATAGQTSSATGTAVSSGANGRRGLIGWRR